MRILITTKQAEFTDMLSAAFSNHIEIEQAENGLDAALKYIQSHAEQRPFTLICLEHDMPVMLGHDALLMIRRYESEYPHQTPRCSICVSTSKPETQRLYHERGLLDSYTYIINYPLSVSSVLNLLGKSHII